MGSDKLAGYRGTSEMDPTGDLPYTPPDAQHIWTQSSPARVPQVRRLSYQHWELLFAKVALKKKILITI